ncbi:MAG: prolyl oligopeptidase family serine peptidase [Endozoicomonas sp.]|uniref:prolyl oligopeptidase family serine peptidase n=1 Tax=Endozoicomonas sp. TaxID=1892382 RepID=UPI003D9BF7B9
MYKKVLSVLLLTAFSVSFSFAIEKPSIDDLVTPSKYRSIKISPDGKYFSATVEDSGKNTVVIIDRKTMDVTGVLSFTGREQPGGVRWVSDERVVASVYRKAGGLEAPFNTGNVVAMNADGSRKKLIFGYQSKSGLAVNPTVERMSFLDILPEDPKRILIASTPLNQDASNRVTAYKLNIYTGKKVRVARSPGDFGELLADQEGQIRVATSNVSEGGLNYNEFYYRESNGDKWKLLKRFEDHNNGINLISFSPDGKSFFFTSRQEVSGSKIDTEALFAFNVDSKKTSLVYRNPRVDLDSVEAWRGNPQAIHLTPDYSKVIVLDNKDPVSKWYPSLQKSFPHSEINFINRTWDGKEAILYVNSEKNPGTFYLFNTEKQSLEKVFSAMPWLENKELAATEAFSMKARDGVELFGYLTLPVGQKAGLPMIIIPHGGPHGPRDYWTYDPDVQFLASKGYAVLKVNFRGSGGYGERFEKLGYRQWGGKMINDMTDATQWAIAEGVADKNRICIYGASYGGYASLMSVVKEPDLYQCAIGYVGIYDMEMMYEKGDIPGRESGENYLKKVLGKDKAELMAFSPAYQVDKIKADLFIIHGEEDIRAHFDHAKKLKSKLDHAGKEYKWLTKKGEGHGFYKMENRKELYKEMVAFFDKNLKKDL